MRRSNGLGLGVAFSLVLLAATSTYAFAAASNPRAQPSGAVSHAISGYAIGDVSYGLSSADPETIDRVSFSISPANAGTVKASLDGRTWYACANTGGSVSCETTAPRATVAAARALAVVAYD